MTHTKIDEISKNFILNSKTINRYFNPNVYAEKDGEMKFTQAVQKGGIFSQDPLMIPQMDFKMHQTLNYFKDSAYVDWPYDPEPIAAFEASYQETSFIHKIDEADSKKGGVFQVYYSQDPRITTSHYSAEYTFFGAIALVGGTISSYYYIMLFTMKGYTSFRYENNLATQLYTTQAKSKPKANEDDDSGIQTPTQKD